MTSVLQKEKLTIKHATSSALTGVGSVSQQAPGSVCMHSGTPIYRLVRQTKKYFIFDAFYKDRVDRGMETWYILVSSRI